MQSILQKLRVITLSNIHTLLDGIKGLNSIGEYEQYIRDLGTARDQIDDQAAASRGRKQFLEQQIATAKARCEAADEQINILLGDDDPSNDHLATPLQLQFDAAKQMIAGAEAELVNIQNVVSQYDQAVQRLDVRLMEANGKLETLRSMDQATKAKEKAAKALEGIDFGSAPDTAGVESKMMERASVADNALNRSLNNITSAIGGATSAEASATAAISKRRAAIEAAKKNTATTATA